MDKIIIRGGEALTGTYLPPGGADPDAVRALSGRAADPRNLRRLTDDSFGDLQLGVRLHGRGARSGDFGRVMTFRAARSPPPSLSRHRPKYARLDPGPGSAARPRRRGDGIPARRLRDRQPANRPALESAAGAWRGDRGYRRRPRRSRPRAASSGRTSVPLMAEAAAKGTTVIENAAREPELDLAQCLIAMGAEIEGLRSDTLTTPAPRRHLCGDARPDRSRFLCLRRRSPVGRSNWPAPARI